MLILHPDCLTSDNGERFVVEDRSVKLTFTGDSADLCRQALPRFAGAPSIAALAAGTSYSDSSVAQLLGELESEGLALDLSDLAALDQAQFIDKIRTASRFWNRHVTGQVFPRRLFQGHTTRAEVLGWGLEFYFFIRSANEYMARGAARDDDPTAILADVWKHYVEEAPHDEIFLSGLVKCGLNAGEISERMPLPSTMALTNFLYEQACGSLLDYLAVFALMQPLDQPPSPAQVKERYDGLRHWYPFAAPLFDAFEQHDTIDADLAHASLALAPVIDHRWPLSPYDRHAIFRTIQNCAEHFILFFEGIPRHYKNERCLTYRQRPTAINAVLHSQPTLQ